jgi:pullulanase
MGRDHDMPEQILLRAHWLDRQTIALPESDVQPNRRFQLLYGSDETAIDLAPAKPEKYPQLAGCEFFELPSGTKIEILKTALKGPLGVVTKSRDYATGVQSAGVLDDLFAYAGKLGPHFENDQYENISVTVWAPTAQSVKLLLFRGANDTEPADTVAMIEADGVWSAEIESSWRNQYYLFAVKVYVPRLDEIVENIVSDPYSPDLALNGSKSRLTDLNDAHTKPEGWDEHGSPQIGSNNELTIWELHVRDFSANDESVPADQRGTYLAFTAPDSNGMRHLRRLADAGIKAVHLLPTFHNASVNEDKSQWQSPGDLSRYPPDSTEQQAAVAKVQNNDGFNWGYDPVNYFAPEGSYAVDPYERVKEYRAMVQALHGAGLRVIQDQVFNHTHSSGQGKDSVLDKIVPGYYFRLDANGNVRNNTCCSDTASEHRMMEKLMVDCLVQNARHYKIDGFRFDLMGYHYVANMLHIKEALPPDVYLYGEGWFTGETAGNPLMPNATQTNMHGTGIGTFNDRVRDAVRGGSPFSDPRVPGFVTGSYGEGDWIRAALAGNMRDFSFTDSHGETMKAGAMNYDGDPVGYTASPIECVNFCSVHDNQVLFDGIQLKASSNDDTATRARRQVLALSIIALGQGIPFFHAGDELLRSKDMDNNSYNSGDWFNRLDFSYQSNNWGIGLPLAADNQEYWPIMQPLLANAALKPSTKDILYTRDAFEALLRVRGSSGLFAMQTLAEVQKNLTFLRTGEGVIAMLLDANGGNYHGFQRLLVVFNATTSAVQLQDKLLKSVHPAMKDSAAFDSTTGTAKVPALTTAVFV